MKLKYFLLFFLLLSSNLHFLQSQSRINKERDLMRDGESLQNQELSKLFNKEQLRLEGQVISGDYVIGPEIAVTGATGFYDYQTNGDCKHYIYRYASDNLSAIYTLSTDSLNISNSRRTVYCFSTNEGASWVYGDQIPLGVRSGFPSLTVSGNGEAIISNHHLVSGINRGVLYVDVAPLAVTFAQYITPYNIAWPGCSRLSNGFIMVAGSTYHNSAATDTGIVSVFNGVSFFSTTKFLGNNVADHYQMRWTYATGPGGKALFLLDPLNDVGGYNGDNRMFISFTTNNGANWTLPMIEFYNPQVLLGDYAVPYYGLDAIYDAAGNYYIAFNTTNAVGEYSSSRLWVSKNGEIPVLVAQHFGLNGIPEAAITQVSPQNGMSTIDHPSLSVSSDGLILYVAYSVMYENDILNGFNKCHIYLSTSLTSVLQFSEPIKVTNSGPNSFDERYPSIAQTTSDLGGSSGKTVFLVYQKDPQPGSAAFMDNAPISRASLVLRKISGLTFPVTGINSNYGNTPTEVRLLQNYPNPFNPGTQILFEISSRSIVILSVYDIEGKFIKNIYNNSVTEPGRYNEYFDGTELSSGIYLILMDVKDELGNRKFCSQKMLLVK